MTGNSLNIDNNYRGYTLHNAQVLRIAGPCALQYSDFRLMHYRTFNCSSFIDIIFEVEWSSW